MPGYAGLACYQHTPEQPDTCKVFHPDGGAAIFQKPRDEWATLASPAFYFSPRDAVHNVGTSCGISDCVDLTYIIADMDRGLCRTINEKPGIANPSSSAMSERIGGVILSVSVFRLISIYLPVNTQMSKMYQHTHKNTRKHP